jgi:diguanylate cyclase (GGDEF)-like protein/PAS domain S-box-containing protein
VTPPILLILSVIALVGASALLLRVHRRLSASLHEVKRQAETLAEQAELLDLAHDAIIVWDLKTGAIRFWNRGAEELYGWPASGALGRTPQAVLQTQFPMPLGDINALLVRDQRWEGELAHTRRDGTIVVVASRWALQLDQHAQPTAVLAINTDITSRKQVEAALEHQALHDSLTGLPNRALFRDRLERALAHAERTQRRLAVLFLDLDNFKVINDSLGHQAGDAVLIEVSHRLSLCLRGADSVARFGGDEFTVLLEEIDGEADGDMVADRILEALRAPIRVGERDVFVSASVGMALSVPRQSKPDSLLRNADMAMYQSKAAGKARHSVYDARLNAAAMERLELETDLHQALELEQFELHYQPIVSLADGRLTEVEALLRWERPGHGLVCPTSFIPVAEETGMILPIGRWVLRQACQQAQAWNSESEGREPLIMSVNLSVRQFQDPDLLTDIEHILLETGLDPRLLKLEITESIAILDVDATLRTLQALKAAGIQLAIDDFGTGYSWLGYLKRFPVDTLKIDRSFVHGICEGTQDAAIVQSVVALARTLNLRVTGEGIESSEQAAHLRALGCDSGQGFLFARPEPAETITALLRQPLADLAA